VVDAEKLIEESIADNEDAEMAMILQEIFPFSVALFSQ
jgi:hypothetical protein